EVEVRATGRAARVGGPARVSIRGADTGVLRLALLADLALVRAAAARRIGARPGVRARVVACAAMIGVARDVGFAPVRGIAIAIAKALVARQNAHSLLAIARRGVLRAAHPAAASAVLIIRLNVDARTAARLLRGIARRAAAADRRC